MELKAVQGRNPEARCKWEQHQLCSEGPDGTAPPLTTQSLPALLVWGRFALHIMEFCKHPDRTQNGAFVGLFHLMGENCWEKSFGPPIANKTKPNKACLHVAP